MNSNKILDTTIRDTGPTITIPDDFLRSQKSLRFSVDLASGDVIKIYGRASTADDWDELHTFSANGYQDIIPSNQIRAERTTDGASGDSEVFVQDQFYLGLSDHTPVTQTVLMVGQSVIQLAMENSASYFTDEADALGVDDATAINGAVDGSSIVEAADAGFGHYLTDAGGRGDNYTTALAAVVSAGKSNDDVDVVFAMIGNTEEAAIRADDITWEEARDNWTAFLELLKEDFPNATIVLVPTLGHANSNNYEPWREYRRAEQDGRDAAEDVVRGPFCFDLPQADNTHLTTGATGEGVLLERLARQAAQITGLIDSGGAAGPFINAATFSPASNEVYLDVTHADGDDLTVGTGTDSGFGVVVNGSLNGVECVRVSATRLKLTGVTLTSGDDILVHWLNGSGKGVNKADIVKDNATNPLPLLQYMYKEATEI